MIWSYSTIEAVKKYLPGYSNNSVLSYKPTANTTRIDAINALCKIGEPFDLYEINSAEDISKELDSLFYDANLIKEDMRRSALIASLNHIVKGELSKNSNSTKTYLKPNSPITRAEAATMIYLFLNSTLKN